MFLYSVERSSYRGLIVGKKPLSPSNQNYWSTLHESKNSGTVWRSWLCCKSQCNSRILPCGSLGVVGGGKNVSNCSAHGSICYVERVIWRTFEVSSDICRPNAFEWYKSAQWLNCPSSWDDRVVSQHAVWIEDLIDTSFLDSILIQCPCCALCLVLYWNVKWYAWYCDLFMTFMPMSSLSISRRLGWADVSRWFCWVESLRNDENGPPSWSVYISRVSKLWGFSTFEYEISCVGVTFCWM